jgi:hypothetical protein
VNASVGPPRFPAVEIRLRIFQALEALPLERRFLRMTDARLDFAFGEKRALQTVTRVDYRFSLSRIRSIH